MSIDEELEVRLKEAMKPVYYNDDKLGQFELDKPIKTFKKKISWAGEECTLYMDWDESQEVMETTLKTTHTLFRDQLKWNKKIRNFPAEELLDLANDWLQDNDDRHLKQPK